MQVLYMLGDFTAGPAFRFTQWLQLVRKRTANYRSSGFPHATTMPSTSTLVTTTTYHSLSFSIALIDSVNCNVCGICWIGCYSLEREW